ncbi:transcription elongation factor GreA [Candidatus Levyibacteriota bacterium]|nr:transcription elongation factor GreA [Candidatus Levybacteria bacterium]
MQKLPVIPFTKEGYDQIQKEYNEKKENRKEAVGELSKARSMGDLSENGYYKAAKMNLVSIDARLRKLAFLLRFGKVTEQISTNVVAMGLSVIVKHEQKDKIFYIVGEEEADPLIGKISYKSPLGRELIGKKVGDNIKFIAPKGLQIYSIVEIKHY